MFNVNDFSGGLLELLQLTKEIPETGLGDDSVGGEDPHFVERSLWLLLCGQFAPDDFVFFQLKANSFISFTFLTLCFIN